MLITILFYTGVGGQGDSRRSFSPESMCAGPSPSDSSCCVVSMHGLEIFLGPQVEAPRQFLGPRGPAQHRPAGAAHWQAGQGSSSQGGREWPTMHGILKWRKGDRLCRYACALALSQLPRGRRPQCPPHLTRHSVALRAGGPGPQCWSLKGPRSRGTGSRAVCAPDPIRGQPCVCSPRKQGPTA